MTTDALVKKALDWAEQDPDALTRDELLRLCERVSTEASATPQGAAVEELRSRFSGPLQFGTAGLRAAIGAGQSRMNIAVVRQTAAGLGRFAHSVLGVEAYPRAVIGFDARHRSFDFARESARVLTAAGCEVFLLPEPLPTPVLAFAVRNLGADVGIMVTASHNPPADNGYKVFLGGRIVEGAGQGAQIVPPFDGQIASAIDHEESAREIPTVDGGWEVLGSEIFEAYLEATLADLSPWAPPETQHELKIVTTAMHGVGGEPLVELLRRAGFENVVPVVEQHAPDPDFPTVSFPNPEEPGAIDLALKTAERENADLVIANDPDADRCAVAIFDPSLSLWRMLRGDELGVVLGQKVLELIAAGKLEAAEAESAAPVIANSLVSSRQLGALCAEQGVTHRQTLTGFKWIARQEGLVFGFEEAIGYLVSPRVVRDKDGLSAALAISYLASDLLRAGRRITDVLDNAALRVGVYETSQLSVRLDHISSVAPLMQKLRQTPPAFLGGSPVVQTVDLSEGYEGLPGTDGLLYLTQDLTRVIVRPSGTEPKLKAYLEVVLPVECAEDLGPARALAAERLAEVRRNLSEILGL